MLVLELSRRLISMPSLVLAKKTALFGSGKENSVKRKL